MRNRSSYVRITPSGPDGAQVVTLNNFNVNSYNSYVKGIDLYSWTDNNIFFGYNRLNGSSSDNFIGVDFGEGNTATGGVYFNVFEALAIDMFGTFANRIGIWFRDRTRANIIQAFYEDNGGEGG